MSQFLYREIASTLRGRITRGEYKAGRLPSERALTAEFGVQRATVRRALQELQSQGLIIRDATRGTFAASAEDGGAAPASRPDVGGIALVMGSATDTTAPGDIARGLTAALRSEGRFVVWFDTPSTPGHAEAEVPDPADLIERGILGCALWPLPGAPVERLRALRDAMPVVLLDRRVPGFESDFVGIDDVAAGRTVTEHLLSLGHRNIGFLSGSPLATSVQGRYLGWQAALRAAGIKSRDAWVLHRHGSLKESDDAFLDTLRLGGGEPLTAVVCSNDTMAARLIDYLNRRGIAVGREIGVTGFGNAFPALLDAFGLTTFAQPFEEIGRVAGQILLDRLRGDESAARREIELPGTLIVRRSCGANHPRTPGR